MEKIPKIYKAIHAVMQELRPVAKDGKYKTEKCKYNYQQGADIVSAVRGLILKHGIVIYPAKMSRVREGELSLVKVVYKLVCVEDESYIRVPIVSCGQGYGDKAVYKALSGAYKYLFKQVFMIEEGEDDYDKSPKNSEDEKEEEPKVDTLTNLSKLPCKSKNQAWSQVVFNNTGSMKLEHRVMAKEVILDSDWDIAEAKVLPFPAVLKKVKELRERYTRDRTRK